MSTKDYVFAIYIGARPEQVWEALTHPDFTAQWWGGRRLQSDWQVGSPVQSIRPDGGIDFKGKILQAEFGKVLSYTFESMNPNIPPTTVTYQMQDMRETVKFTMTQAGHDPDSQVFIMVREGWIAILSSMKSLLETGKPLVYSFWKG